MRLRELPEFFEFVERQIAERPALALRAPFHVGKAAIELLVGIAHRAFGVDPERARQIDDREDHIADFLADPARVGFDWPHLDGVRAKLAEEIAELEGARRDGDQQAMREEMGDVIFTVVNLARTLGVDAEGAMRDANEKFYRRFSYMERRAQSDGRTLGDLSIDELEELWQLAKTAA